jgi:hypothetical protein
MKKRVEAKTVALYNLWHLHCVLLDFKLQIAKFWCCVLNNVQQKKQWSDQSNGCHYNAKQRKNRVTLVMWRNSEACWVKTLNFCLQLLFKIFSLQYVSSEMPSATWPHILLTFVLSVRCCGATVSKTAVWQQPSVNVCGLKCHEKSFSSSHVFAFGHRDWQRCGVARMQRLLLRRQTQFHVTVWKDELAMLPSALNHPF